MSSATYGGGAKLIQTDYDRSILSEDASFNCSVCLTRGQIRAIIGMLEQWGWITRWYSPSGEVLDQHEINVFQGDLSWRLTTMCCDGNGTIERRVSTVTGTTEISTDGGNSWKLDPEDPRNSGVQLPAPVTAGVVSDQCAAAASATEKVREYVTLCIEQKTATATLVEFLLAVATFLVGLLVAPLWALLPALISGIMNVVFGYTILEMSSSWTSAAYQKVLCLLNDNIQADGTFTQSGFDAVVAGVGSLPNAVSASMFKAFLQAATLKGLNNAAALGLNSVLTCDDCDSPCDMSGWTVFDGKGDNLITALGHVTVDAVDGGDGHWYANLTSGSATDCCCVIASFEGGTPTSDGFTTCPDEPGTNINYVFSNPSNLNTFYAKANEPFTVTLTAVDCP